MVRFEKHLLDNGLTVLIHQDTQTPLATTNLLYKVGSREESPDKTGFAHLFEHLMFGGSKHADSFDDIIQLAGGECNAYTNADITNYYNTLPAINLDTVLWLEADRMQYLNINEEALGIQQQVVIEEFKETCINQPYGLVWHMLADLCYKVHSYRWPTIGKIMDHIAYARLEDVRQFYNNWYVPENSILSIAGPLAPGDVLKMVDRHFGKIPTSAPVKLQRQQEPQQMEARILDDEGAYPSSVLYLAWLMDSRTGSDYYAFDLLSDVMSLGRSALFYQHLVKERKCCAHVDAYITGTDERGLFIIEARPAAGISIAEMEAAIWEELSALQDREISTAILEKLKIKNESTVAFGNVSAAHKAANLAYYESIGDAGLINLETDFINRVNASDIRRVANHLRHDNVNILRLHANGQAVAAEVEAEEEEEDDM